MCQLVLRLHWTADRRADGAELVVRRHALPHLPLHRERRDAWQLPRILDPIGVQCRYVICSWTQRLVRIGSTNSRPLQPRRVILLPKDWLVLDIAAACLSNHILLLYLITLHIIIVVLFVDPIVIVRSIR